MPTPLAQADGGFTSRKLWYAIGTSVLVFATGVLAALWPAFRGGMEVIVGGLIGTLAVYSGANVSSRWVNGKNMIQTGNPGYGYGYDPYGVDPYYSPYALQAPPMAPGAVSGSQPNPVPPVEPVPEEQH